MKPAGFHERRFKAYSRKCVHRESDLPPFSAHRIIRHFSTPGLRLRTAEPLKRSRPQSLSSQQQTPAACDIPRLLCGRSTLYSLRHTAILRRASNKF
jgi:hypothetical protein